MGAALLEGARCVGEGGARGVWGTPPPIHGCVEPVPRVNDRLNGFLPRLQSQSLGWRRAAIVAGVSKCTGATMRTPELEVYLSSGFHVQWSVLALRLWSMDPLILLWVSGTMEEEVREEMKIRADPNL